MQHTPPSPLPLSRPLICVCVRLIGMQRARQMSYCLCRAGVGREFGWRLTLSGRLDRSYAGWILLNIYVRLLCTAINPIAGLCVMGVAMMDQLHCLQQQLCAFSACLKSS